jgi:hypothetical protein
MLFAILKCKNWGRFPRSKIEVAIWLLNDTSNCVAIINKQKFKICKWVISNRTSERSLICLTLLQFECLCFKFINYILRYIKATRYMHLYDYAYSWLIYLIRLFTIFMLFSSPGYQSKNYHFNSCVYQWYNHTKYTGYYYCHGFYRGRVGNMSERSLNFPFVK